MSLVNLKLIGALRALVLVQELDHVRVVVEFDQAEHIVGAELGHVDLADIGGGVREELRKPIHGLLDGTRLDLGQLRHAD